MICEVRRLPALANADLSRPPQAQSFFNLEIRSDISAEQRKIQYGNWLLSKAFQDLAKGIRLSLEQAYFYVMMLENLTGQTTWSEFQARIDGLKAKANKMDFPTLMAAVSARLMSPLNFNDEFLSLQKVRNCLEHRNGIVASVDVNNSNDALRLTLPRLKLVISREGRETEITGPVQVQAGERVGWRYDTRVREYKIGERVTFTHEEFLEIAQGCLWFAQDLGTKLPQVSVASKDAAS